MRQILAMGLLAFLAGCVTAPLAERLSDADMRALVRSTALELDQFSYLFGIDGEPDFTGALTSLSTVRLQLAGRATVGLDGAGLRQLAETAALGAAVSVCEENLSRLRVLYITDKPEAMAQARDRFRLSCVMPLSVFAA